MTLEAVPRKVYILTDEDRYGETTFDLGCPPDIELVFEKFFFDTKHGDRMELLEDVPAQIARIEQLISEFGELPDLVVMLSDRRDWLTAIEEEERQRQEQVAYEHQKRLEAARELLREAGELPRD